MTADEIIAFLKNNDVVKVVLNHPSGEVRTVYCTLKDGAAKTPMEFPETEVVDTQHGPKTRIAAWDLELGNWVRISAENLSTIEAVSEVPAST